MKNYQLVTDKKSTYLADKKGKKLKFIPKKYVDVAKLLIIKDTNINLNATEAFQLEVELFKIKLKSKSIHLYELAQDLQPVKTFKVNCKFNENRFEILLGNYAFKCSEKLYLASPIQETKYAAF